MCKYCELKKGSAEGEFMNEIDPVLAIVDGHQVFSVYLNRYIHGDTHESSLILDYAISDLEDRIESIKEEEIKIKYCPFCGEEL